MLTIGVRSLSSRERAKKPDGQKKSSAACGAILRAPRITKPVRSQRGRNRQPLDFFVARHARYSRPGELTAWDFPGLKRSQSLPSHGGFSNHAAGDGGVGINTPESGASPSRAAKEAAEQCPCRSCGGPIIPPPVHLGYTPSARPWPRTKTRSTPNGASPYQSPRRRGRDAAMVGGGARHGDGFCRRAELDECREPSCGAPRPIGTCHTR